MYQHLNPIAKRSSFHTNYGSEQHWFRPCITVQTCHNCSVVGGVGRYKREKSGLGVIKAVTVLRADRVFPADCRSLPSGVPGTTGSVWSPTSVTPERCSSAPPLKVNNAHTPDEPNKLKTNQSATRNQIVSYFCHKIGQLLVSI